MKHRIRFASKGEQARTPVVRYVCSCTEEFAALTPAARHLRQVYPK